MRLNDLYILLGGLGLFLFGMKLMGDGLELASGSKLKSLIEKLTKNKYMGALIGLIVTAIIQSSSATTVMVVGFVNAGLMNLGQAVGVIMGANIGTTVTSIMIAFNFITFAPLAVFIGVVMMLFIVGESKLKHIGIIIAGFGILFLGMDLMSKSMESLSESEVFRSLIVSFKNPFVGLLIGLVFTAIIQSSSASIGVLQALGMAGAINLSSAVYVIYGQNIGTCVTALLSSLGTSKTAKRTAIIHLLFNVFGAILFTFITMFLPLVRLIESLAPGDVQAQISWIHLMFNVVCVALLLPMSQVLIKISCRIIPGKDKSINNLRTKYLDERILNTPPIAVGQVIKEVERMGIYAQKNLRDSIYVTLNWDEDRVKKIYKREDTINFLNTNITSYLVMINGIDLNDEDRRVVGSLFHVINDLERIGDHSKNICQLIESLRSGQAGFSEYAMMEIKEVSKSVELLLKKSLRVLSKREFSSLDVKLVADLEDLVDDKTEILKANHIDRLNNGKCSVLAGTIFMDLLTNLERVADHSVNVAFSVVDDEKKFVAKIKQNP